ncbi:MAG: hypothetical protein J6S86_05080, partial [Alphaproteobacteria bacterium]|nr:hypothetical protein [Alphaproteobacteria bacterium]
LKVKVERTVDEQIMYDIGEYRKSHTIESSPSDEDLSKVVKYLRGLHENDVVKTSDIRDVTFKYEELVEFVEYFKGKDGVPSTITVERTPEEKISYEINEYLKTHNIESLPEETDADKEKLCAVVMQLKGLAADATVKTSDITNVIFKYSELREFVEYLKAINEISSGITVEMTYKEAVTDKISKYTGAVWGLTPAEAYTIVEFLNSLPNNSKVNGDQVEAEVKRTTGKDVEIEFTDLKAFVDYLKNDLTKTIEVVKTDSEKIDDAIEAYYPTHPISELTEVEAKAALREIANYVKDLPSGTKTRSSTVMEALKATTPKKIPDEVNLTHDDMVAYIEALNAEKLNLNITVLEEESTLRSEIDAILDNYAPSEGSNFDSTLFNDLLSGEGAVDATGVQTYWGNAVADAFLDTLEDPNDTTMWKKILAIETAVNAWSSNAATAINNKIGTEDSLQEAIKSYLAATDETTKNERMSDLLNNNNLSALGGENLRDTRQAVDSAVVEAENLKVGAVYDALVNAAATVLKYALSLVVGEEDLLNQVVNSFPADLKSYCKNYYVEGIAHPKIKKYVEDYYTQEGAPKVGNLNLDQAYKLAVYLESRQPNQVTEKEARDYLIQEGESLTEDDLTYADLSEFVSYLYKKGLTINIERSQGDDGENQRIIDLILLYEADGKAKWSTSGDRINEAIYVVKYLNKLCGMIRTSTEIINYLKTNTVSDEKISPDSTIAHEDLIDLVNYLNDHRGGITVTITKERSPDEVTQIKATISNYGSLNSMGLDQGQEINQAYSIVDCLSELNGMTRTDEAIINYLKDRNTTLSTITTTPEQLINFMNYMREKGVDLTVEITNEEGSTETLAKQYLSSYLQLEFYRFDSDTWAPNGVMDTIYNRIMTAPAWKYTDLVSKVDGETKTVIGENLAGLLVMMIYDYESDKYKQLLSKLDDYDLAKGDSKETKKTELEDYIKGSEINLIVMNHNPWSVIAPFYSHTPTKDEIKSIILDPANNTPPYDFGENRRHAGCWDGVVDKMAQDLIKFQLPSQQDVVDIYKSCVIDHFYDHSWRTNRGLIAWLDVVLNVKNNAVVPAKTDPEYITLVGDDSPTTGTIKWYLTVSGSDADKKTALRTLLTNTNLHLNALFQFVGNSDIDWSKAKRRYEGITLDGLNVKTLDYTYSQVNVDMESVDEHAVYNALAARLPVVRMAALMSGNFLNSIQAEMILAEVTDAETPNTVKEKSLMLLNSQNDLANFVQIFSNRNLGSREIIVDADVAGTQSNIREAIISSIVGYLGQNVTLTDAQKIALVSAIDNLDASASQAEKRAAILSYIPSIDAEDLATLVAKLTEIKEGM